MFVGNLCPFSLTREPYCIFSKDCGSHFGRVRLLIRWCFLIGFFFCKVIPLANLLMPLDRNKSKVYYRYFNGDYESDSLNSRQDSETMGFLIACNLAISQRPYYAYNTVCNAR